MTTLLSSTLARRAGSLAVSAVMLIALGACGSEQGALAPEGSSARDIAWLFWVMTGLGGLVVVLVAVILFLARHGNGNGNGDADELVPADRGEGGPFELQGRSARLVLGGGVLLPLVVLVPLTVAMLVVATRIVSSGPDPVEIEVIGHQFWWEVRYLDDRYLDQPSRDQDDIGQQDRGYRAVTANEIHIPVGRDVRLRLRSNDVIHSFWVPQLAGKIDMIPGQTTELIIDADREGEYLGQCAEFCGLQHARMRLLVIAQPADDFEQWLADQADDAEHPADGQAERGAEIFDAVGCGACHTVRGTPAQGIEGPDLTHLASRQSLGAMTLPNTSERLAEWILDPHDAKPGNLMPPTDLDPDQLADVVAYLEGLR